MVSFDKIERANSPFINSIVVGVNKDGTVRISLDSRKINICTLPDFEGSLLIQELLPKCGEYQIIISLDLIKSFYQITLAKECIDYNTFFA